MIEYYVKPINPNGHLFSITCCVNAPSESGHVLSLPNWIPGSYMIRDFSKNIIQISAKDENGQQIPLEKVNKSQWKTPAIKKSLQVDYLVYAWDLSVRAAHLDQKHGFFNGTSLFLSIKGMEDQVHDMVVEAPDAFTWRLATAMTPISIDAHGFGRYRSDSYDEVIDHPVEMGTFASVSFLAYGVPHEMVFTGNVDHIDLERIAVDVKKICEAEIDFFGHPAPVERYVFMTMVVGDGYGGLEHRASTALVASRNDLPLRGEDEISDAYLQFLGLCSHEYFHTWNVKRITPSHFVPFDLSQEQNTELLWFFEGVTSYYDDLFLLNSGLITQERYLSLLARTMTVVHRGQGRLRQSVADSSFDAWNKFYKQDENAANSIVSYYTKGALIALCLDLMIRQYSENKNSLADLMRSLWLSYLKGQRGITQSEIERNAEHLAGRSLQAFFQQAVFGTEDLPLNALLLNAGVSLSWGAVPAGDEMATKPQSSKSNNVGAYFGARFKSEQGFVKVLSVVENGPAQLAGVSAGDLLISVSGIKATSNQLKTCLQRSCPGMLLNVLGFRRDELMSYEITLGERPHHIASLKIIDQLKLEAGWLNSVTN